MKEKQQASQFRSEKGQQILDRQRQFVECTWPKHSVHQIRPLELARQPIRNTTRTSFLTAEQL
jgi:hypothetical protein